MAGIAANVLDRQFDAGAPNQKWVADFTYVGSAEGWLYVAVVLDMYSRRVIGWSIMKSATYYVSKLPVIMFESRHR